MATTPDKNGSSLPLDKETLAKLSVEKPATEAATVCNNSDVPPPVISDRGCVDTEN